MKSGAGFTFVELMISVSIMLILLLLSFPFYLSINKQLIMDRAATKLVQDIRKAAEMTMSAQEFNNDYPDGGYGIYFPGSWPSSESYYLFADENGNRIYDSGELVEEVKIGGGIEIFKALVFVGPGPIVVFCTSITFKPPEPMVYFNKSSGGDFPITEVSLRIYDSGGNHYDILINKVGLVYIQ